MCTKCGENKPLSYFSRHVRRKDGRSSDCKVCQREYQIAHPAIGRAAAKRYAQRHPDKVLEAQRNRNRRNPEKNRARVLDWQKKNKSLLRLKRIRLSSGLSDTYVKKLLYIFMSVPFAEIPPELVEAKRQHLKIYRLIKEKKA